MMNRLRVTIARTAFLSLLLLATSVVALGQDQPLRIKYWLAMSHPSSHLFEVSIEVDRPADSKIESLDFQMAKWSPGRYAVFDFAKNVQEFQAAAGICPPKSRCDMAMRPVTRIDDQTWRVPFMNSPSLTIRYKVFANNLSGTFSELDSRHANFNGGCVFMYVVNHKQDPGQTQHRSSQRLAHHKWPHGKQRPRRVAVSQLGHHDRHAHRNCARLD